MKDGKRDGRGKFTDEYGVYEGGFKDGKFNRHGVFVGANGDRYEGDWKDGLEHGRGVYVLGPNSEWAGDRYEGEWKDGKMHGRGTQYFADGDKCEGDWREGRLLGTGRGWAEGRQMKCYFDGETIQFTPDSLDELPI